MHRFLTVTLAAVVLGLATPVGMIGVSQPVFAQEDGGDSEADSDGDQAGSNDSAPPAAVDGAPAVCEDGKPCPVVCVQGKSCLQDLKLAPSNIQHQITVHSWKKNMG